jgi:hypothetical protein
MKHVAFDAIIYWTRPQLPGVTVDSKRGRNACISNLVGEDIDIRTKKT